MLIIWQKLSKNSNNSDKRAATNARTVVKQPYSQLAVGSAKKCQNTIQYNAYSQHNSSSSSNNNNSNQSVNIIQGHAKSEITNSEIAMKTYMHAYIHTYRA